MAGQRIVAVVGARVLPEAWAAPVAEVVGVLIGRGWGIGSGGARGADQYALEAVVAAGAEACRRSIVFLPGAPAVAPGGALGVFVARGGRVVAGSGVGRAALLGRSRRLVVASSGVVAFLWGPSRGSGFTVREAVRAGKPAAVVLGGGGARLPSFPGGGWQPCVLGLVAAFRWVPSGPAGAPARMPHTPEVREPSEPRPTALHRIFVVPEGEPVQGLLAHISSLSPGERLWFEQGVLAGDTVLVPHEVLSDTPAWLALPRLRRRFRCTEREAAGLAEVFLALEAGPAVVAHYEAEARRRSIAAVLEDLVHLVAQLALVEQCPEGEALEEAECLGEWAESVASDGHLAPAAAHLARQGEPGGATLGWHALGTVHAETVTCPGCGARYPVDDEAAALPTCPGCGTPDTWEARQPAAFRRLVATLDGCASLGELATLGKRLYALALSHEQAGVAWTHYRLRRARLEAAVTLGAAARALVAEVEAAPVWALGRLGARLYRLQHAPAGASALSAVEWRRVWAAWRARKGAVAA